jgi:hypothetical protein
MSDYEYYEGLEGAGDDGTHSAPDSLWADAPTGADHNANTFSYEDAQYQDAQWGPSHETGDVDGASFAPVDEAADSSEFGESGFGEYDDPSATEEPGGLLDGLEFDLSGLDLGSLSDMQFDATYDLIGSSPGEQGWWSDLASDHNHDGAYETVSADDSYLTL